VLRGDAVEGRELAEALRTLVDQYGLTIRALERRMPYSKSQISELLSGSRRPAWRFVEDLMAACVGGDENARAVLYPQLRQKWEAADPERATPLLEMAADRELLEETVDRLAKRLRARDDAEMVTDLADDYKPDPSTATSLEELESLLRQFWLWAGLPSSRSVAKASDGAFSHATVAKILYDRPGKPPLRVSYVRGMIRGCGGSPAEERAWITAWRMVQLSARSAE
jgi:transcriptional regulator with XRE-family HTH domain